MKVEPTLIEVVSQFKGDVPYDSTEFINVRSFESGIEPARVEAGISHTINLGDYESLKIHCNVTLPCHPHPEEIKRAQDHAFELAKSAVKDRASEVISNRNSRR